jgi:hypothetical protein
MSEDLVPLGEDNYFTTLERLKLAAEEAVNRPGYQEPTYHCSRCCDVKFTTRVDSQGRVFGTPCDCLLDERANKPKIEAVKFRGRERHRPIEDDEGIPF